MKVGLILGLLLGSPYVTTQLWGFVSPGLFRQERKFMFRFAVASTLLFAVGATFALFGVFPALMRFSAAMATPEIRPQLDVRHVIDMAGLLVLGFGIVFQLPIVIFSLLNAGIVKPETLSHQRPIAYVVIFIVAAILTPPDIVSQLAMGIPACLLFEAALLLGRFTLGRKRGEPPPA
jgi:sec-independent protein translocase protein TatC